MDWYDILWKFGGLVGLAYFLTIEGIAIATHNMAGTLSEHLRKWLGIYPVKPWRKLGGFAFTVLVIGGGGVLVWHILTP